MDKLFNLSEPMEIIIALSQGCLKAVKEAYIYKALKAVPGIKNHPVNVGNYYYYSWNTCVEKAFRDLNELLHFIVGTKAGRRKVPLELCPALPNPE